MPDPPTDPAAVRLARERAIIGNAPALCKRGRRRPAALPRRSCMRGWTPPPLAGYPCAMLNTTHLDDLAKRLSAAVPSGLAAVGADLDKTFHAILQAAFEKMNLVSREEFEAQKAVLARTRDKLDKLAARVAELERQLPAP